MARNLPVHPDRLGEKRFQYEPSALKWARDLLQGGAGWVEASRRTGVPESTLWDIAKRENWFVRIQDRKKGLRLLRAAQAAQQEQRAQETTATRGGSSGGLSAPGPAFFAGGSSGNGNDAGNCGAPPPVFSKEGNPIDLIVSTLLWAIEGISQIAGGEVGKKLWLVEKLPAVGNFLLAVEQSGHNQKIESGEGLLEKLNERLLTLKMPLLTVADMGEVPEKDNGSKKIISSAETEAEIVETPVEKTVEDSLKVAADQIDEMMRRLSGD